MTEPSQSLTLPRAPARRRISQFLRGSLGSRAAQSGGFVRLALFGLTIVIVSVTTVAVDWGGSELSMRAGDAADRTIKATETVSFQSDLRTEERRQEAFADERNIATVYDENVRVQQTRDAQAFLQRAEEIRDESGRAASERAAELRTLQQDLDSTDAERIITVSDASWQRVSDEAERLVDTTLANQLRADELARVKEGLSDRVSALLSAEEQRLAVAIARPLIRANVSIDEVQTLANRQRAAAEVEPVIVTVLTGQAVVRDGDILNKYDIEKLEKLGLLSPGLDLSVRLGQAGIMAILSIALVGYFYRFHREVWQGRQLLLLAVVIVGPIVMARLALPHDQLQYMFPVAAAPMLLAVLLDFQIAAMVSVALSMYLGVIANMSLELVILYFVSSVAGAFIIWRAERTMTFVWAGIAVGVTTFAVAACFNAIESELQSRFLATLLLEAAVGGVLSASLTFLSFSLMGSLFGITTHLQLLELAHPNQPLLYRLAREAPGTYHHSIVVSNLAETGVEIVGGDPLFARVAVLYHDIGKIVRPTFFIENQANLENPHDLLDPRVSARVIIDHVTDGVRLAKKARLPQPMIDVIAQHHGTSLIRYFYNRTIESGESAAEDEFRYPGPKPQTKEAGIIMLADSVEAAVRASAMGGHLANRAARGDTDSLDRIVDRVIQERLDDGQLTECDLTLREIDSIRRVFVQILNGIYHPRVEYPSLNVASVPVAGPSTAVG